MTIQLTRVTLREIHLPLVEPFRTAGGVTSARRVLLAELQDADGTIAWAECVAEAHPGYSPETVDGCWLALQEWIVPPILAREFASPGALESWLARRVRGNHMARATMGMGAWALDAMREGIPLALRLAREVGATPAARVETGIAVGMQGTPNELAARVCTAAGEGYRRVKVKIEPGRDVEWVRAARAALPRDVALTADANCSYTLDDAAHLAALDVLDTLGLAMIEQPLGYDDLARHATLQRRLRTPLCLDESIRGPSDAETMLALGSARVVNLKPGRVGGYSAALAVHELCRAAGVALWCGGMLETGIGRAFNVALASLPGFTDPGDLSPSARYWERDIVSPPWTMDARGAVRVPLDRPGLGVDVDASAIDALTVRSVTLGGR